MTANLPNLPSMDLNKYEQYISKSLTAGTEGKNGAEKAQLVLKNMSHNMKVFISQVHTYFNEKTKNGERKWVTNERVVKSINKKLAKLEKKIDDADKTPAKKEFFLRETIAETKKIIKTFEKAGVSDKEIQSLQDHVKTLDGKWKELKDKPVVIALKEREPVAKEIGQAPEKSQEKGLVPLKAADLEIAEEKKESIAKKSEPELSDAEPVLDPLVDRDVIEKNLHDKKAVKELATERPKGIDYEALFASAQSKGKNYTYWELEALQRYYQVLEDNLHTLINLVLANEIIGKPEEVMVLNNFVRFAHFDEDADVNNANLLADQIMEAIRTIQRGNEILVTNDYNDAFFTATENIKYLQG
jgi:hypothetical protein